MDRQLSLEQMAIHYVDPNEYNCHFSGKEKVISSLAEEAVSFLVGIAMDQVIDAPETGATSAGRFIMEHERVDFVRHNIAAIANGGSNFFAATVALAQHLQQISPIQASPGILAILRMVRPADKTSFATILKIRDDDRDVVRLVEYAPTELTVERLGQVLVDKLLKGATLPHPYRSSYDAKVVDKQASSSEPARYFTESFLGISMKRPDEYQTTHLLPQLQLYAAKEEVDIARQNLPAVVQALLGYEDNITIHALVDAVEQAELYGEGYNVENFGQFINENLGSIDIRQEVFAMRGRTRQTVRRMTYFFSGFGLDGLILSGPPDVVSELMSVNGDRRIFHFETTRDGYRVQFD
jgi:hypothetical protein